MDVLDMEATAALFPAEAWKKSMRSNGTNDGCLWANTALLATQGVVGIADRDKPELGSWVVYREEWTCFVAGVRAGEFD